MRTQRRERETVRRIRTTAHPRLRLSQPSLDDAALLRLAYVAAETGARFVRDRIDEDPFDWLTTRKRIFDDSAPVYASIEPEGFRRAVALHGLSIGLDCAPELIAEVPATAFLTGKALAQLGNAGPQDPSRPVEATEADFALFTATIVAEMDGSQVQIFCAMIARSIAQVRARLCRRFGPLLEEQAAVRLGFDWGEPLACALVSPAMAHLLQLAMASPASTLAAGLDFQIEQRFAN